MRVGLVQINSSFSGQCYLPYSVGVLQAYATTHLQEPEQFEFLLPIYKRVLVQEAVAELESADVVAFSCYVWNEQLSLAIAKALKECRPETLIVFGGPQIPHRTLEIDAFLRNYGFIDLAVHHAGEISFTAILEHDRDESWDTVPSVSFLDGDRILHRTPQAPSLANLDDVPSPYLTGMFDSLMREHPEQKWIALWETNRNCPFSCTFCGWGLLESKPIVRDLGHVRAEIDWFADHHIEFVFCADANFGLLHRDIEIATYAADVKRKRGYPKRLSVQDTKNVKERAYQVRTILGEAGLNTSVVISLQSVDPATLKIIRRDNIKLSHFYEIQRRFAAKGIETMTDLILGLPGETYDSWVSGISEVIASGQHNRIQFNNLSVVPDAEMSDPAYMREYGLQTVRTHIVNIHGKVENDEVPEFQELVITTNAMPAQDWVRARAFAWMAGFLHFDKILQIPFVIANAFAGISYRDLIELFSEGTLLDEQDFPLLMRVRRFFLEKALAIQQGGVEYCHASRWLDIYWPADEYMFIELCVNHNLDLFYEEAERALELLFFLREIKIPDGLMHDALQFNKHLIKLPFQPQDIELECSANIRELHHSVIVGSPVELVIGKHVYRIDRSSECWTSWDEWYEKVVWYGNKSGAYLYGNKPVEMDIAGHY